MRHSRCLPYFVRLLTLYLVTGALVACRDTAEPASTARVPKIAAQHLGTGECHGIPEPGCTVIFTAAPANYHCAVDCYFPGGGVRPAQHEPIVVTFSQPIYQLIVYSGGGAFTCSGTYGTVTAYNRTHLGVGGWQVEQRDFVLLFPDDCGYDQVTGSGVDTLHFPGGIARLRIDPPQPWEFPVYLQDGSSETGYESTEYYYYFYEHRPPTAPCLTGDELLDQQAMRDFLRAAWDSSNVNDLPINRRERRGWLFEDSTGNLAYGVYPNAMDTPCTSIGVPPSPEPGIRVARGHTHPFAPDDDLLPPICGFTTPHFYDIERYGGPSPGDIRRVAEDGIPGYIVDKINLYVIPVGTDTLNAKSNVKRYPRVDPVIGCTRL